jgi:hypothetical protein
MRELLRLGVSWLLLGAFRLLILTAPFSVVRRLLGRHETDPIVKIENLPTDQSARAHAIGAAVQRAARHTPWQSNCYPQALTARAQLLAFRIPHTVKFGLRRDTDGDMVAHTWVRAGEVAVCGGDGDDYFVVGSFSWLPRSDHP